MRRIAVIGSGISGLSAAYQLAPLARVSLFEAADYFGGHTHTVDLTLESQTHGVDTGFLVFNERTYPKLIRLFGELNVPTVASDMSFSVKQAGCEWSGSNLNTVFAQRSNLLRPTFWRMLADILRFNRLCHAMAEQATEPHATSARQSIGDFLIQHNFSDDFRDGYLLPMVACIWSCPTSQMLHFPMLTLVRFCHNHGLIQVTDRPRWFTVRGGARCYVEKMLERVSDRRLNTPVRSVRRLPDGAHVLTDESDERFDAVVMACHSDQSLALLADPSAEERAVLGAIRYHDNRAVLHTDASLLPERRRAWAAWNYARGTTAQDGDKAVCLHYWLNRLQPLPFKTPVIVSLNPITEPRPETVHGEYRYAHPVFDLQAIDAQASLPALQGRAHTWFCGAWTRYGFHEDGLMSGFSVAESIAQRWQAQDRLQMAEAAP